jgi:hypothetical protein
MLIELRVLPTQLRTPKLWMKWMSQNFDYSTWNNNTVCMKMAVLWLSCSPFSLTIYRTQLTHRPDDGGSTDPWNIGKLTPVYTALQPRRQPSSIIIHNNGWRGKAQNMLLLAKELRSRVLQKRSWKMNDMWKEKYIWKQFILERKSLCSKTNANYDLRTHHTTDDLTNF